MRKRMVHSGILAMLVLLGLFLAQRYSFLLFHCLAEGFSIVIACGIFMLAWNTRRFVGNYCFLFLGIAYLFIGGLDLMHTLIYKGMGVFHGYNANAATQLWIAARYSESISLLLAPIWIDRKLSARAAFWVYGAIFTMILAAILSGRVFPDCFIEGQGLTPFKIASEYIICLILMAALAHLYKNRTHFDAGVLNLLYVSIVGTMASEIAFTFYISVYGLSNQIGHFLKIISFFMIYKAIIQTGLLRPYDVLFRDLKQSHESVKAAHDQLEQRVQERTADLLEATGKLQAEIAERKETQKALLKLNQMLKTLSECNQSLVRATDERSFLSTMCQNIVQHGGYGFAWVILNGQNQKETFSPERLAGEDADFFAEINTTRSTAVDSDDPINIVLRTGRARILKAIRSDTWSTSWITAAVKRGYTDVLLLPLATDSVVLGVLVIFSDQPGAFDPQQLEVLTELANDVSFGITTVRMQRQRLVVEAELQLLATAIDQASECIAITNSDASIEYINQAVKRITGLEPHMCIGRPLTDVLGLNQAVPLDATLPFLKAARTWSGRCKKKGMDGSVLDLSVAISPVKGPSYKIEHFVAIIGDITRECQMEHQLLQSQKMEAIGTLAGGIAHDFNNILSAIIGYTELTVDVVGEKSIAHENLGEVLKAGRRAKELVHQILAFSRQTIPECKPISLKQVIEEAGKLLRSSLPATIEIRQRLHSNSLVMADATRMHQVVMNLCTNAAYAMRENGGLLELTLQDKAIDGEQAAPYPEIQPGPYLKLSVRDTGIGIPQDIMDHIFDPFFTTKAKDEGTGMGLSVVHGIVRACGGMVSVSSDLEKGTCFNVIIPAIGDVDDTNEADQDPLPVGSNEHILFIDDEPTLANLGRQVLESLGYQVTTRTDGTEALDLIKSHPDRFDLVFTDLTMPKITGDRLAQQIVAIRPELPVILCSGFSNRVDECKAAALGIRAYVRKPILREQMARIIREVLKKKTPSAASHKSKTKSFLP